MLTLGLAYNYGAARRPAFVCCDVVVAAVWRHKRQQAADSPVLAKPLG